MKIKEAVGRIREHNIIHQIDEPRAVYITKALDMAIKSLEAWDKVIEEIDKEFNEYDNVLTDLDYSTGLGYALAVIDEHLGGES